MSDKKMTFVPDFQAAMPGPMAIAARTLAARSRECGYTLGAIVLFKEDNNAINYQVAVAVDTMTRYSPALLINVFQEWIQAAEATSANDATLGQKPAAHPGLSADKRGTESGQSSTVPDASPKKEGGS